MSDGATVVIGDRFYWSLQLAQQVMQRQASEPDGVDTLLLRVVDIQVNQDGTKTIVMADDAQVYPPR